MIEHRLGYRVPYAEVDRMGVVYYGHYLTYFERGRTEFLRRCGLPYGDLERDGVMLPVIEAHCEYLKPARYEDELTIVARAAALQGVRLRFDCEVYRDDTLLARGHTWHVSMTSAGKPCRVPPALAALFSATAS